MPSNATLLLQAKWLITSCRVQVAFQRLRLSLRAYHADQPRVPAGNPDGGQWTDGDAGGGYDSGDEARLVRIGERDERRYQVDLEEEEERGHTLQDHVGKTDDAMMQRVLPERARFPFVSVGRKRDGSFPSREAANDFLNRTLENNAAAVDAVAEGENEKLLRPFDLDYRRVEKPIARRILNSTWEQRTVSASSLPMIQLPPEIIAASLHTRATMGIKKWICHRNSRFLARSSFKISNYSAIQSKKY